MRRVVFNQKGGVGKSTICCNLAAISAARVYPVTRDRRTGGSSMAFKQIASVRGRRLARRLAVGVLLLAAGPALARMLPGESLQQLPQPWPPAGWTLTLDLPEQTQSHASEPRLGNGYFGQTLYRRIAGTSQYWTANVLIQDRGDAGAAWRAVSAVSCNSRVFMGYRARECTRGDRRYLTKSMHYEVDRYYVTIQVAGPGDTDYPRFELAVGGGFMAPPIPERPSRRNY